MNDTFFYNEFLFLNFKFQKTHYTDNRNGNQRHYLALMKNGRARFVYADGCFEVYPGDLFFIPKGLKYESFWESENEIEWDSFGFESLPENTNYSFPIQKIVPTEETLKILNQLSDDKRVCCLQVGRLYTLMGILLPSMKTVPRAKADMVFNKCKKLLHDDIRLKPDELANKCNMSVSKLYKLFRENIGISPNTLRQKVLCEKAVNMLTSTDLTVEEISSELEFSSSSYFRKTLYKITGKTPTEIRRMSPF